MKAATGSSPRSGGHTGKDGRDISVFDFDEKDPRPFRDKQSSKALFSKAFGAKGKHSLKCATISVRHGKCARGAKATNNRKQGPKFTKKSCQQIVRDEEATSQEFISCSDKIETDDSDSVSEGEVLRQPTLKKRDVVEKLTSSGGAPNEFATAEKVTDIIISGEELLLSDGACICSPCFKFSVDAITLTISKSHSDSVFIQWPLKEISSFGSYTCQQSGLVVLELGLTYSGAQVFIKKLTESIPFNKEGHVLVAVIRDIDWVEHQRQITSLSDAYKFLWRPLKLERHAAPASVCMKGFLRSLREQSLDRDDLERNGSVNSGEEDELTSQGEERRHAARLHGLCDTVYQEGDHDAVTVTKANLQHCKYEIMLQGWFDIVYPKGDHDAVTVTRNDFLLLRPEEFLSDTIIDFYIKHLQSTLSEHDRNRFYFFNSFFFRKLTEGENSVLYEPEKQKYAFERVKRWTAKINIFEKDYLFIPIMRSAHWSLIVICHPGCVSTEVDEASTCKVPLILHFDSLEGCHTGLEEPIQNYLMEAWMQKYGYTGDRNSLFCKRLSEVKFMSAKVPQQTNYSDCGLFLLHYVELLIGMAHSESPTEFVNSGWFNPAEASNKRADIQNLIIWLHAMELADRYPSLSLPDNLALAVKNKNVSLDDALAIQEVFALRFRESLHSSKASEVVQDGPVGPMGNTIPSDSLHDDNQMCMGIFDTYDRHKQEGLKGEDDHYSHPDSLVSVCASESQSNLCSSQLQDSFSSSKKYVFLALEAPKNCLGSTRKEDSSILSEKASVNLAHVDISPNSENFSVDSNRECMRPYHLTNSWDDHGQKIVEVPNSSHGVLIFRGSELHGYSKEISAVGTHLGSTVDKIHKLPTDAKQLDLRMECEVEDTKFSKFTQDKGVGDSGSISDTDKEETHPFKIEESMDEDIKHTLSNSALKDQNMVVCSSRDQQSKGEPPANRNSKEYVSLQKKDKICEAIDSECNISIYSNPCPLQEQHLWYDNQDRTDEISLPNVQDTSRVDNTHYISSDEDPSTPQYQAGLGDDVERILEAVNLRKGCKRKVADDSKAPHVQGRRPVTRSTTKRRGVKSEKVTLVQQGRKHESPIEVK